MKSPLLISNRSATTDVQVQNSEKKQNEIVHQTWSEFFSINLDFPAKIHSLIAFN